MNETTSTCHYKAWKTQALKGSRSLLNVQWGKFNCFQCSFSSSCTTRSRSSVGAEHHRIPEDASHPTSICCQQFSKTAHPSMCINRAAMDVTLFQPLLRAGMTQNQSSSEYRDEKPCSVHGWEDWLGWEIPMVLCLAKFCFANCEKEIC